MWLTAVTNAVTACAINPETAFEWITRVDDNDADFDELGAVLPEFSSLDAKLRAALTGQDSHGNTGRQKELGCIILAKSEELKRAMPRRQIRGRQIVLLVRQFFEIKEDRRIQYELTNLLDIKYPGDAKMSSFKYAWDNMVRNMSFSILTKEPKTLEQIFYKLIKRSDALSSYLQHYERLRDDHEDRSYRFLSEMVDKAIREERHLKNQQSLVNDASGKSFVAAPGTVKSRGDATKPKRDRDGKGFGGSTSGDAEEGGTNTHHDDAAGMKGLTREQIPSQDRCCILHFWRACHKHKCKFPHRDEPNETVKQHRLYLQKVAEWGEPTNDDGADGDGYGDDDGEGYGGEQDDYDDQDDYYDDYGDGGSGSDEDAALPEEQA